jgi:hypothetical protein
VGKNRQRKPTVKERVEKYKSDPRYAEAIEANKRANAIVQRFRLGAKLLCARKLWREIKSKEGMDKANPPEISDRLKITREQVYRLEEGYMSF